MYIVFEGIDGTGKSTQIPLVQKRLQQYFKKNDLDIEVVTTKEPELQSTYKNDYERALAFALQRMQIWNENKIKGRDYYGLFNQNIIISDRSFYSSLAYQKAVQDYVEKINIIFPRPVEVFYFEKGIVENNWLEGVRQEYLNVIPEPILVDTAQHSIEETTDFITKKIIEIWEMWL